MAKKMNVTVEQLAPLVACYRLFFKQIIRHSIGTEQVNNDNDNYNNN